MRIGVLVKQVPDTWSDRKLDLETGMLDRAASESIADEIGERAAEVALQIRETHGQAQVVAVSMGPESAQDALRKLLAMGADEAHLVTDPALTGADLVSTARVLAAAVDRLDLDLVVAGVVSTDGNAGVMPAMIAEILGRPHIPAAEQLSVEGRAVATVQVEGAELRVSAELPAVVSVTEKVAEPRFPNFKNIMAAKKKPMTRLSLADLGVQAGPEQVEVRSVMVSAERKAEKVAGPKIQDDGSAAGQLADFLAERNFV